ncbi:hypothetical protein [Myxosarcina sp. GI1(2024)]
MKGHLDNIRELKNAGYSLIRQSLVDMYIGNALGSSTDLAAVYRATVTENGDFFEFDFDDAVYLITLTIEKSQDRDKVYIYTFDTTGNFVNVEFIQY